MWVPASASLLSGCGQHTVRVKSGKESPAVPRSFPLGCQTSLCARLRRGKRSLGRVSSLSSGLAGNAESVTALKRRLRGSGGFYGAGSRPATATVVLSPAALCCEPLWPLRAWPGSGRGQRSKDVCPPPSVTAL